MSKYDHVGATLAIARASLRSILRSPSSVVFTLAFPLIFILVFGFIGGGGVKVDVGVAPGTDTVNPIYKALEQTAIIKLHKGLDTQSLNKNLSKGSLDAVLKIKSNGYIKSGDGKAHLTGGNAPYTVDVNYTTSSAKGDIFKSIITNIKNEVNIKFMQEVLSSRSGTNADDAVRAATNFQMAEVRESTITGRAYKTIDFILPGQLGFSLLSTGVFGTAFVFLSLRITLVIKRFFATPVKRASIVLGEALARICFSLIGALFIIIIGHFAFGFTLVHGVVTVINMLILSVIGLIVFMGFGFTVSGIAKNESSVPPIANIITLPQFLLSGTFFSIDNFPAWLQPLSRILPLTYLNDAMRKVAFEGAGLGDVTHQLLILLIWGVVIYTIAVKTFKWE
ncbi:ABC transporter permease [Mucilaginibacter sp. JRF]|uniref:ABC transporter permease n=1 Tax=Mucilaginibacter sp. JRF TaxID=2780088 RepID=UPI0018805559|nr:ABC transporter permease [Mucilaginibacter sp. JRF]MBE9584093.1 ABC transporter permease [Mucilaginibacter sp. JRF]